MRMTRHGTFRPILTAVLVVIVLVLGFAAYEVIWAFRAKPNVTVDYPAQWEALSASVQPEGENRWPEFESAIAGFVSFKEAYEAGMAAELPEGVQLEERDYSIEMIADFDSVLETLADDQTGRVEDLDPELVAEAERVRDGLIAVVDSWDDRAFVETLRDLRDADARLVRPVPRDSMMIASLLLPELMHTRGMARLLRVRMHLAVEREDWASYTESARTLLWLGERSADQPLLISGLVGMAVRMLAQEVVREDALHGALPASVLREVDAMLERSPLPDPVHALRGERIWSLDAVQWLHDSRGRLMTAQADGLGSGSSGPSRIMNVVSVVMPRRAETEAIFNDLFGRMIIVAEMPAPQREDGLADLSRRYEALSPRHVLPGILLPAVNSAMTRYDQLASTERGTRTVLAVELYRLEKGALPESLDDLVPAYLDAVPNEHWAPIEPLRYERDASALGYRLYTVGSDGEDNGGTEPEGRMQDALTGRQPGTDFVFTRFPE